MIPIANIFLEKIIDPRKYLDSGNIWNLGNENPLMNQGFDNSHLNQGFRLNKIKLSFEPRIPFNQNETELQFVFSSKLPIANNRFGLPLQNKSHDSRK